MRHLHTLFILTAALSFGAPVTYNSLVTWQAAGPQDPGFIGFNTVANGQYPSFVLSGFTFAGIGANLIIYNPVQTWSNLGAGISLTGPQGPSSISISFPTGVYGIGFLVGSSDGSSLTIVLNSNTGNPITIPTPTTPPGSGVFWGVRDNVQFTTLTITGLVNVRPSIDSVVWGAQATAAPDETPEAATALLIGGSLLLLPVLRRRFLNSQQQQLAH